MKEGLWYEKLSDQKVHCLLCPHGCRFGPGGQGICRVRKNHEGTLVATNYGKAGAYGLDPVEKKPLYHFFPGTQVLSVGARGCNFSCQFCQNWELAQGEQQEAEVTAFGLISAVEKYRSYYNVVGLAYTYSEPFMWYEFMLDTAVLAKENGLKNVVVTNGFVNETPLDEFLPYADAFNIDIKAFTEEFYRKYANGSLAPVLNTAEKVKKYGAHLELTTLLIPGLNDSEEEIRDLVKWIASALGRDTPLHFSRYFPNYKMKIEATPVDVVTKAREIALEYLNYVYMGNMGSGDFVDSFCPKCNQKVVERRTGRALIPGMKGNTCSACGERLNFIGV